MINIEDYNFEEGRTDCDECTMQKDCEEYSDDMVRFQLSVRDKFGYDTLVACQRFKITKKIKDENTDN